MKLIQCLIRLNPFSSSGLFPCLQGLIVAEPLSYVLIHRVDLFSEYQQQLIELLKLSSADDAILGFDTTFDDQKTIQYLVSLEKEIASQSLQILVGQHQETLVVCCFFKRSHQQTTRHLCDLQKGMIHPHFRSQGLLEQTLAAIACECMAQGVELLTLDVRGGTKAHRIWEKCGFETYGILNDYSRFQGKSFDGYFMKQRTQDLWNRFKIFYTQGSEKMSVGTELIPKKEFRTQMRETLEKHLTLGHPLFKYLLDEKHPNSDLLKFTTLQGYQLTKNFLTYIEHLFFHCPLPKHKRALLHNMYEEETGRLSNTKNHVELMQDFVRALGISDAERDAATALPQTQALIDYRMIACKNPDLYHIGAAAVMVASEGQNLESVGDEARHNILGKVYDLKEADLLFFSVHQEEDVGHVQQGLALLADLCDTPKRQQEAIEAIETTCELFYQMYQGVYEYFGYDKQDQAAKAELIEEV